MYSYVMCFIKRLCNVCSTANCHCKHDYPARRVSNSHRLESEQIRNTKLCLLIFNMQNHGTN